MFEDPPNWVVYAHLFLDKVIQIIRNVSLTTFFTYLFAATMEILKIPKDKTRDEMKTKEEEIKHRKLKEIEHQKGKLEKQVNFSAVSKHIFLSF